MFKYVKMNDLKKKHMAFSSNVFVFIYIFKD
jgi:hypothetical protein